MNILRTLDSIQENMWGEKDSGIFEANTSSPIPLYNKWNYADILDISKVKIWEQLYHDPGNIGLFAAWNPYIEYYIIVNYPFLNTNYGIITYYGEDACRDVVNHMREISVNFEVSRISLPSVAI